jgi:sulfur-carrier protein
MITFQISGYLTEYSGGQAEITVEAVAANVGEALQELWSRHAALRDRVLTEQGQVRPHVNIFVNSQVVQRDRVLQTSVPENSEICIMPAVSGGDTGTHASGVLDAFSAEDSLRTSARASAPSAVSGSTAEERRGIHRGTQAKWN